MHAGRDSKTYPCEHSSGRRTRTTPKLQRPNASTQKPNCKQIVGILLRQAAVTRKTRTRIRQAPSSWTLVSSPLSSTRPVSNLRCSKLPLRPMPRSASASCSSPRFALRSTVRRLPVVSEDVKMDLVHRCWHVCDLSCGVALAHARALAALTDLVESGC